MNDEIGWVTRAIVERDEAATGTYRLHEWPRYCVEHGIEIMFHPLLLGRRAYLIEDTLVLATGLSHFERAWYAWEEIGHHATSVGNREFWRTRPQGHITLAKMERRARDYRLARPIWESDDDLAS